MNRQLLFRCWDSKFNKFRTDIPRKLEWLDKEAWDDAEELMEDPFFQMSYSFNTNERLIWMPSIFKKDKNNKDIFEFDIIKLYSFIGLVIWNDKYCGFVIKDKPDNDIYGDFTKGEIIGNVFENKELLTWASEYIKS